MRAKTIIGLVLALGMLTGVAAAAPGVETPESQESAIGRTPPRLSFTKGEVSFWRPGAQEWSQAQMNTPLAPGDELYTGSQGSLELQIGSRAFVRAGENTQLGLENQEPDFLQLKVTEGTASFDLRTIDPGRTVEVDTPNAVFTIEHAGYYRVGVAGGRTSFTTRRGGQATVISAGGESVSMAPSEETVIEGTESPQVSSYAAPQLDAWDKWNYDRTGYLLDAVSARHVPPGTYGVDDLDRYGTWRVVPSYGSVWVPGGVPSGWAPYSTGSWMLDPYYGWTWVDTAPWGWAPYHHGRWVHLNGFWGWAPGPVVARPVYAPALVAFYGGSRGGVSVSIGLGGPLVGWVALGWGEPCVPWWGSESFRHRPSWHGWGGPRVVNNVVINNTTVVNVQEINVYRNAGVQNAVVAVNENRFGRGPIQAARVAQLDEKSIRPTHAAPQVSAAPASFEASGRRGIQPPERVLGRRVVATRPPHAPAEAGPGVERAARPRVPTPAPHIVSVPQQRESTSSVRRAPFGQSGVERPNADRARPPVPPRTQGRRPAEQATKGAPSVTSPAPATPQQPSGRQPEGVRAQPPVTPKTEGRRPAERAPEAAPSATRQAPTPQKPTQEVAPPSPARPQTSAPQIESDRARPPAPPKTEGRRPAEQGSKGAPPVTRQAPSPQQPTPQVPSPAPATPQPSARQPESVRAQPPVTPKTEARRPAEQAPKAAPSVTRQAPTPQPPAPQVTRPAPAAPQPSARQPEAARPPARVLPGEPANRMSPNRAEQKPEQRKEQRQEPQKPQKPAPQKKGEEKDK